MKIYSSCVLDNGTTEYHLLRELKLWPLTDSGVDLYSQIESAMNTLVWAHAESPILAFSKADYSEIVTAVSRITPPKVRSVGPSDASSCTAFAISPDNVGGILQHALEPSGLKIRYIPCTVYGEPCDGISCASALIDHNFLCCVYKSKKK